MNERKNVMRVDMREHQAIREQVHAGLSALRVQGRQIWGDDELTLGEIIHRLMVGVGDLARLARDFPDRPMEDVSAKNVALAQTELKKELGNIIFSTIRWVDDLGLDVLECLDLAIEAQEKFASSGETALMGAWGYGPFDNDDAGDMVAALTKKVRPVLRSRTDASSYYPEARVAIQFMLLAHGTDILGGPDLDIAIDALVRMRRDVEWLCTAVRPRRLAQAIEGDLAAVLAKMTACKGCRQSIVSAHVIVKEALTVKVPGAGKPLLLLRKRPRISRSAFLKKDRARRAKARATRSAR